MESQAVLSMRKDYGLPFVLGLIALSTGVGVFVYGRYVQSDKHITLNLEKIKKQGEVLTIEDCATQVLAWHSQCTAMQNLCDDTVPRMMSVCLQQKADRFTECGMYGEGLRYYNFGVDQCKTRGAIKGSARKACANLYLVVGDFCKIQIKKNR
jgi:hypothetical protein